MKAILLAAGQSSRLYPFAQGIHKSMIEIMGKPLLEYTINELKNAGIKDLIIVINKDSGVSAYFEDGSKFGVSIKYIVQDKALGMGNALLLAKDEIDSDFLLLNAYHFDVGSLAKDIINERSSDVKAVLLAKRKNSILGQGVLKVDGKKVIEIVEKVSPAKFEFMALGDLITKSKKIASLSQEEILLSEKIKERFGGAIKAEKQTRGDTSLYIIREIKDTAEHEKNRTVQ